MPGLELTTGCSLVAIQAHLNILEKGLTLESLHQNGKKPGKSFLNLFLIDFLLTFCNAMHYQRTTLTLMMKPIIASNKIFEPIEEYKS